MLQCICLSEGEVPSVVHAKSTMQTLSKHISILSDFFVLGEGQIALLVIGRIPYILCELKCL